MKKQTKKLKTMQVLPVASLTVVFGGHRGTAGSFTGGIGPLADNSEAKRL